jgi:hypothetical protein
VVLRGRLISFFWECSPRHAGALPLVRNVPKHSPFLYDLLEVTQEQGSTTEVDNTAGERKNIKKLCLLAHLSPFILSGSQSAACGRERGIHDSRAKKVAPYSRRASLLPQRRRVSGMGPAADTRGSRAG